MVDNVFVNDHPLVQHKLTLLRDKYASCSQFRQILKEMAFLLGYEVTKDLELEITEVDTPIMTTRGPILSGKKLVLVAILRAGNGLLDALLELIRSARVGHMGIYRDPETLKPVEYLFRMPEETEGRDIIILDPMLATGNTVVAAIDRIKPLKPRSIKLLSVISCPEGIQRLHEAHPDVALYTAAIDQKLDADGYIVPGLGDAGDRLFGTK